MRTYRTFTDDFERTAGQDTPLPDGYRFVRTGFFDKLAAAVVYGAAVVFSPIYCRLALHLRIKNRRVLRQVSGGYFLYGNHTQPVGDVFIPGLCALPKRVYTVVSPANLGIPVIGRLLPALGALPLPDTAGAMRAFTQAVHTRITQGHPVTVFPEAHVWAYYTGIRPFPEGAFRYPCRLGVPAFCMTAVYTRRRRGKKPRMTVYLDGPFWPDESLPPRERAAALCAAVHAQMTARAAGSNAQYIRYEKQ